MRIIEEDLYNCSEFFCPPLWRQRRNFILDVVNRFKIETILDYGCGEAAVLSFMIPPFENKIIKMAGIDIDENVLVEAIERCTPWKTDFEQLRPYPLSIDIFQGSIGIPDGRLKGYQAIICTEVIEHVQPDVLNSFLDLTLGIYDPEILIVTTPNAEYNVNFPDLKYGTMESIFRHDDHKFEWTRKEFQTWCEKGATKYGYKTEYHGIGLLHGKYNELENGYCTQACIFIREAKSKIVLNIVKEISLGQPHKLLKHIEFPYYDEPPLTKDQIIEELKNYIQILCEAENYDNNDMFPIDFNLITDWNTFDLSKHIPTENDTTAYYINDCSATYDYTAAPIIFPLSSLWNIHRIQLTCKTREYFIELLSSLDAKDYEIKNDNLCVYKSFKLEKASVEEDYY
ncbi:MAG: hypothetical protein EXX96DRAFT_553715 [Benjaminiella poitrasii]|nr:MAG: hypothetical protein EXX96DRAFT_553715 [Benjaminiella poitrasii]